jgi:mediator of RNA polymerase II transcription subunit 27
MSSAEIPPSGVTLDALIKSLRHVQQLRSTVSFIFERLGGGVKSPHGMAPPSISTAITVPALESTGCEVIDKQFLADIREGLYGINTDFEELDKLSSPMLGQYMSLSLGNPSLLSVDPLTDKSVLYSQLVHTYKWSSKAQSQSQLAYQLLANGYPKRSVGTSPLQPSSANKRSRRNLSSNSSYTPQQMELIIQNSARGLQDFNLTMTKPFGSLVVLQITIGRTLRAVVILRGFIIEWVTVRAFHETAALSDNDKLDLWSPSRYSVFQKVTANARTTMMHMSYQEPQIRQFLIWLHSYRFLFSTPCLKCKRLLNDFTPPTFRDVRCMEPYHDQCRP